MLLNTSSAEVKLIMLLLSAVTLSKKASEPPLVAVIYAQNITPSPPCFTGERGGGVL